VGREGGARGDERGQWEAGGSAFHPTIREPDPYHVMSELISQSSLQGLDSKG
jgi:hypothetical protein